MHLWKHINRLLVISLLTTLFSSLTCHRSVHARSLPRTSAVADAKGENNGLRYRLSEVEEQPYQPQRIPAVKSEHITPNESDELLKRLPPITVNPDDDKAFALRENTLPPPLTVETISTPFPPPPLSRPEGNIPAPGPLEIIRFAPEGDMDMVPNLSITFSQPMVPVSSQEETASFVPVKLAPQPPGKWRWIGTKTLLFEPDGRFPMSTDYSVTIPAGTTSATGGVLAATKQWRFSTALLNVTKKYPEGGPYNRNPLVFLEFNQRIDREAFLSHVSILMSSNSKGVSIRLASPEEIAADSAVSRLAATALSGQWLALRILDSSGKAVAKPLPAATSVFVSIKGNAPSAEGPLRKHFGGFISSFYTYHPLRQQGNQCGYQRCRPTDAWSLTFNNPLAADSFSEKMITVEPKLPGMTAAVYGDSIVIRGEPRARTSYRITVDKSLRDIFGQTLGSDAVITRTVDAADPALTGPDSSFVVLDAAGPRRLSVFSRNHPQLTVDLYAVTPEQMPAFDRYWHRGRINKAVTPPGKLVAEKKIDLASSLDELTEAHIELEPALTNGLGNVVVVVEPTIQPDPDRPQRVYAWVQSTRIGLSAFIDGDNLLAWANALADGRPLAGVELSIRNIVDKTRNKPAVAGIISGDDGLASLSLPDGGGNSRRMLVARKGEDFAFLPESTYWGESNSEWGRSSRHLDSTTFTFTDRGVYRPGEEVHLKGWLRYRQNGKNDRLILPKENTEIRYEIHDSRSTQLSTGITRVNRHGGFEVTFKLPDKMNLGTVYIRSNDSNHLFQTIRVEEFRRPEFEVQVSANRTAFYPGEQADLTASAGYYAGGGLPDSDITWRVTSSPAVFTPPNRSSFIFGRWRPWWRHSPERDDSRTETFTAKTDPSGRHRLHIDLDRIDPPFTTALTAEASVADLNRQSWSGKTRLLVHPADLYVGLRNDRTFVNNGEPLTVQAIVTNLDGGAVAGRAIDMQAARLEWRYENNSWHQRETNIELCEVTSTDAPVTCRFKPKQGGKYRISATVTDDRKRANRSEMIVWVAGDGAATRQTEGQEKVELIPDRQTYQEGETAQILVQAPFFPTEGVLTLRRNGLVQSERFAMTGPTHVLSIPLKEEYIPNLHVQVDLVGAAPRSAANAGDVTSDDLRPAFAMGTINLAIPPLKHKLTVTATPRERELEPKGETTVDLELRDAVGKPVNGGEVALVVVDEAVLALTGYLTPDPLAAFYPERYPGVNDLHLRNYLYRRASNSDGGVRRKGEVLAKMASISGGMAADALISLRADFNPLAVFAASVQTDERGRGTVTVRLPDNLTRYRVMAVAAAGSAAFGAGESTITARLPLMVRPSPPRFLNFGDRFELPVVVQNQTDTSLEVDLVLRAANARLTDGAGRRLQVPPHERVEVRFPATTVNPGTARFQVVAQAGRFSDAAELSLPVWTPATTEGFATYGEIDSGAIVQPVRTPANIFSQFGGLEITTSSTQLQGLTDAVLYLSSYPFDCAEQVSSRLLSIAGLRDILSAFAGKGLPAEKELLASVELDIKRLHGLQNYDGGFALWQRSDPSVPFISIHVAHALQRAGSKGFAVPPGMIEQAKSYLRNIEQHLPSWYHREIRETLTAYALYVRNRMGDRDIYGATQLIAKAGVDKLAPEALGWLLSVLSGQPGTEDSVAAIRRNLANRVIETAGMAHFTTSYQDQGYLLLHSDRRVDAIILEALIGDQPQSDLIPKIVRDLLAHRINGRWANTQDNVFVLLALDRYFHTYENITPDFISRVWLGDAYAGDHQFKGHTTERHRIEVPMSYLASVDKEQLLTLSKDGPGRLYYRIGLEYAPTDLFLKAYESGFAVKRLYEPLDKPADVRRAPDGSWHIKAGARIRVKLAMTVPTRRYHVALVDPLPAGFEALNPSLAVTGSWERQQDETSRRYWGRWQQYWFEHQNLRDERVEAFATLLYGGVYTYSYVARATTPGEFVVPPAKAEEMYAPETFGRSGSDRVIVVE